MNTVMGFSSMVESHGFFPLLFQVGLCLAEKFVLIVIHLSGSDWKLLDELILSRIPCPFYVWKHKHNIAEKNLETW